MSIGSFGGVLGSAAGAPLPQGKHVHLLLTTREARLGGNDFAQAPVGDVDPPAAPTGLEATPDGRDVALTWDENTEPDVTGYVVVRDGSRIGTSPTAAHRDEDPPVAWSKHLRILTDAYLCPR